MIPEPLIVAVNVKNNSFLILDWVRNIIMFSYIAI